MDLTHYFETLGKRLDASLAAVHAAAEEDQLQLRKRIDQAEADAKHSLKDTEQDAGKAATDARNKWAQMKADASAKMTETKSKIDQRGKKIDASIAQDQAEMAEADAASAIDFAGWAIDNARYVSLHAIDARGYAEQLPTSKV